MFFVVVLPKIGEREEGKYERREVSYNKEIHYEMPFSLKSVGSSLRLYRRCLDK